MKKIKVAVLMGGISSERQVSLISGGEVVKNLDKEKYEVVSVDFNGDYSWVKTIKPDIVFIALHGKLGEDGSVQNELDKLGIKYIGSGPKASRIGMNKIEFKELMQKEKIKTPNTITDSGNKYPLIVKPVSGGSSIGVSVVNSEEEFEEAIKKAKTYDKNVMVEEYIKGIEVACGVVGNNELTTLPVIEICPKHDFFDYDSKYDENLCEEIVPARISADLIKKIEEISIKIYNVVGCRGFARVDFIIKDNIPFVLEINTIPGLTPNSLLPKEAKAAGIEYSELLDRIVNLALESN